MNDIPLASGVIGSFEVDFATSGIDGDFNNDGVYNCNDINMLTTEVAAGSNDSQFDLDGDGVVTAADTTAWLAEAGSANLASGNSYLPGDANLDGAVDGSDFNIWNESKFTASSHWCDGNFNGDAFVDGSDFNVWNANKFTSADLVAPLQQDEQVAAGNNAADRTAVPFLKLTGQSREVIIPAVAAPQAVVATSFVEFSSTQDDSGDAKNEDLAIDDVFAKIAEWI